MLSTDETPSTVPWFRTLENVGSGSSRLGQQKPRVHDDDQVAIAASLQNIRLFRRRLLAMEGQPKYKIKCLGWNKDH